MYFFEIGSESQGVTVRARCEFRADVVLSYNELPPSADLTLGYETYML